MMLYFWPHLTPFWEYVIHTKPSPQLSNSPEQGKRNPIHYLKNTDKKTENLNYYVLRILNYMYYISPPPKVYIPYINVRYTVLKGKKEYSELIMLLKKK